MTDSVLRKALRAPSVITRRIERNAGAAVYRRYFHRESTHPAIHPEVIDARFDQASQITFLCMGNICRSPFAAQYARKRAPRDVSIYSAGLSPFESLPSPPNAVSAASDYDVDLTDHRSQRATAELLAGSDLVFVMDFANYYLVKTRHRSAADRTALFGSLDACPSIAISDPHGADRTTFDRTYARIARILDDLVGQ